MIYLFKKNLPEILIKKILDFNKYVVSEHMIFKHCLLMYHFKYIESNIIKDYKNMFGHVYNLNRIDNILIKHRNNEYLIRTFLFLDYFKNYEKNQIVYCIFRSISSAMVYDKSAPPSPKNVLMYNKIKNYHYKENK